jgi:hypothetical protein
MDAERGTGGDEIAKGANPYPENLLASRANDLSQEV